MPEEEQRTCRYVRMEGLIFDALWYDHAISQSELETCRRLPSCEEKEAIDKHFQTLLDVIRHEIATSVQLEQDHFKKKPSGGRPEKFHWDLFWIELVKVALHPDGLPERKELHKRMMEYCTGIWGDDAPGESTVRAKLAKLHRVMSTHRH